MLKIYINNKQIRTKITFSKIFLKEINYKLIKLFNKKILEYKKNNIIAKLIL